MYVCVLYVQYDGETCYSGVSPDGGHDPMRGSSEGERELSQLCLLLSHEMVVILSQLLHSSLNHPHL